MSEILKISNLTVGYEDDSPILESVNLSVYENDFLGIIGPNGGGKTTLLKAILGLLTPRSGKIDFVRATGKGKINIGYLPQINQIDKKFPISVFDVIMSGISIPAGRLYFRYTKSQKDKVRDVAIKMGVENYLQSPIGDLSGGQLQRTLLGRAIIDDPDLLILDEPNSYVDKRFETNFYNILDEINKTTAVILVSHDVGTVISLVKNIACVNRGIHYHSGANITNEWLEEHYMSCPIEIVGHGKFPHRILEEHSGCDCCHDDKDETNKL